MALSPRSGRELCADMPAVEIFQKRPPRCARTMSRLVGSPTIAPSAVTLEAASVSAPVLPASSSTVAASTSVQGLTDSRDTRRSVSSMAASEPLVSQAPRPWRRSRRVEPRLMPACHRAQGNCVHVRFQHQDRSAGVGFEGADHVGATRQRLLVDDLRPAGFGVGRDLGRHCRFAGASRNLGRHAGRAHQVR